MGDPIGPQTLPPFESDAVLHYGQHVAMVVAETREEANTAAALVEVTYERHAPVLSFDDPRASLVSHAWTPITSVGTSPVHWREPTCGSGTPIQPPTKMFTTVGLRPNTIQQVAIGASGDGQLTAIEHVSTSSIGMADELVNLITYGTAHAYACPNVSTHATRAGIRYVLSRSRCRSARWAPRSPRSPRQLRHPP